MLGIAERIRAEIAALRIQAGGNSFNFTVSIGAHHPDTMLQKVDGALYAAKDGGRNRVQIAE